ATARTPCCGVLRTRSSSDSGLHQRGRRKASGVAGVADGCEAIRSGGGGPTTREKIRTVQIGIIGGSGLYNMNELTDREERTLVTPFGESSGPYIIGTLRNKRVAFLARHGIGH